MNISVTHLVQPRFRFFREASCSSASRRSSGPRFCLWWFTSCSSRLSSSSSLRPLSLPLLPEPEGGDVCAEGCCCWWPEEAWLGQACRRCERWLREQVWEVGGGMEVQFQERDGCRLFTDQQRNRPVTWSWPLHFLDFTDTPLPRPQCWLGVSRIELTWHRSISLNLYAMASCNRCGTILASGTSRTLKVHRLHCKNIAPMKYKPPSTWVPKQQEQKVQEDIDDKVCTPQSVSLVKLTCCVAVQPPRWNVTNDGSWWSWIGSGGTRVHWGQLSISALLSIVI